MVRSSVNNLQLVFTCEHGGHKVPAAFKRNLIKELKQHSRKVSLPVDLDSRAHINWDPGALQLTKFLSLKLKAPYFANTYSRRLIDCNRSDNNPARFSPWADKLSSETKQAIEAMVSHTYKDKVRGYVRSQLRRRQNVILFSIHSFSPKWRGRVRSTELGLLYRPWEKDEMWLAKALQEQLQQISDLKVHMNLPYRGHTDCFSNELSNELKSDHFTALMIEVNYGLLNDKVRWSDLQWSLATAIKAVLGKTNAE